MNLQNSFQAYNISGVMASKRDLTYILKNLDHPVLLHFTSEILKCMEEPTQGQENGQWQNSIGNLFSWILLKHKDL